MAPRKVTYSSCTALCDVTSLVLSPRCRHASAPRSPPLTGLHGQSSIRHMETLTGHCLCGSCRFTLTGPHNFVGHCHCESCRRATSSPVTTWIGQENGRWTLTGDALVHRESSPGNMRGFCGTCGSPMYFKADRYPNEVHFYAALLDDPDAVTPTDEYHRDERLAWMHMTEP